MASFFFLLLLWIEFFSRNFIASRFPYVVKFQKQRIIRKKKKILIEGKRENIIVKWWWNERRNTKKNRSINIGVIFFIDAITLWINQFLRIIAINFQSTVNKRTKGRQKHLPRVVDWMRNGLIVVAVQQII